MKIDSVDIRQRSHDILGYYWRVTIYVSGREDPIELPFERFDDATTFVNGLPNSLEEAYQE